MGITGVLVFVMSITSGLEVLVMGITGVVEDLQRSITGVIEVLIMGITGVTSSGNGHCWVHSGSSNGHYRGRGSCTLSAAGPLEWI